MAIKLEEGGGDKALMAWPIVEELFFLQLPLCNLSSTLGAHLDNLEDINRKRLEKYCKR